MSAVRLRFNRWLQLSLFLTVFYRLARDFSLLDVATSKEASSSSSMMTRVIESAAVSTTTALRAPARRRHNRTVSWLTEDYVPEDIDFFSASWYMSVNQFLETNVSEANIGNVEAGCFGVFRHRYHLLRMSLDWLDFSVEHMSKWWRTLGCPEDDAAYNTTVGMFSSYIHEHVHRQAPYPESAVLGPTLAMIAFQPYRSKFSGGMALGLAPRDHAVTTTSLGATLASLVQVGMGRIVVVGYESGDEALVRDAFRLLNQGCADVGEYGHHDDASDAREPCRVHGSELVYVRATDDLVRSRFIPVNLPRAAVAGLMRAYNELQASGSTHMNSNIDLTWTRQWLGNDPNRWQYVYLTEPDTILQTRPSALQDLGRAMDDGMILSPHRFQPLPHRSDAPASKIPHLIPQEFKMPQILDGIRDDGTCCDAQEGDYKPGRTNITSCGDFWWVCGYGHGGGNHSRLEGYDFVRIRHGTGIVTLAGNEHGRQCHPAVGPGSECQYRSKR